jgi:iron complex outermembrane recepter protein
MRCRAAGCLLAATIPTFVTFYAFAQESQGGLEEIVVTATRREQNLQDVPISIVAVTGDTLQLRGLDSLERVSQAIPNLVVTGGGGGTGQTNFTVRGIPNVGTYVDGVWQVGTNGLLTQGFVDIDRIEVLRGPQGTEFGRDSTGGAIRIWTKKPSDQYNGDVTVTAGSYDRHDVTASVDLPITDKFLTRFTGASLNRDGYVYSLTTGKSGGDMDQQIFRGDALWTPSDKLTWRFNYQYDSNVSTEPRLQDAVFKGTYPQAGQAVGVPDLYEAAGQGAYNAQTMTAGYPGGLVGEWQNRSNITQPNDFVTKQFSSDLTWDLTDKMKIQFITAQTDQDVYLNTDWDNSQWDLVDDVNQNHLRVFSQEIQLTGGTDRVKWVGGAYYWDQLNQTRSTRYQVEEFVSGLYDINAAYANPICTSVQHPRPVPPGPPPLSDCEDVYAAASGPGGRFDSITRYDQHGYALFGEATISLTKKIDMTIGMRHHDQHDLSTPESVVPGVTAPRAPSANDRFVGDVYNGSSVGFTPTPSSFDKNTYRFSVQDQFTPDFMGYIGYSEGFNSGGASVYTDPSTAQRVVSPYLPQLLKNTEVGIRSDLANKHVRINATIFHTEWQDIQSLAAVFDSAGHQLPILSTQNVGSALATGAELEMTFVPGEHWLFNVNLGYLDARYTEIAAGTFALDTGTAFAQAPKDTGSIGAQYTASLNKGASLTARVDYLYQGQFWRSLPFLRTDFWTAVPAGFDESGGSGIVNARLAYSPPKANWNIAVFGTNLTDERLINSGFFHGIWGFDFATVGRPREGGVSFNFKFQ